MKPLVMLDLFSGLGGASAAMVDRGWQVITVEIEERAKPTIVADVAHLPLRPFAVDLLWASPPCTAYSRKYLSCWYPNEPDPDLSLYHASKAAIAEIKPTWWVLENVQGAAPYWGQPDFRFGSRLLWTNIPMLPQQDNRRMFGKMRRRGNREGADPLSHWRRSLVPYAISEAIAITIESLTEAAA